MLLAILFLEINSSLNNVGKCFHVFDIYLVETIDIEVKNIPERPTIISNILLLKMVAFLSGFSIKWELKIAKKVKIKLAKIIDLLFKPKVHLNKLMIPQCHKYNEYE